MKKLITLLLLWSLPTLAADINAGYSFSSADTVTSTKLNNLVGAATINSAFITGKSAVTAPVGTDILLLYSISGAGLRKVTLDNLIYEQPTFITSQGNKAVPEGGDYLLIYDATALTLSKTSVSNLLANTNAINILPQVTIPILTDFIPVLTSGTNAKVSVSNLFNLYPYTAHFTNLEAYTAPTNLDALMIWDSVSNSNKQISLRSLVSNSLAPASVTGGDLVWGYSTNSNTVVKLTITQLQSVITNAPALARTNQLPTSTNTAEFTVPAAVAGGITNLAHGLAGTPQIFSWILVCKSTDAGYAVGDEVDAKFAIDTGGSNPAYAYGANATNIFIAFTRLPRLSRKDGSNNYDNLDTTKWKIKGRATYLP